MVSELESQCSQAVVIACPPARSRVLLVLISMCIARLLDVCKADVLCGAMDRVSAHASKPTMSTSSSISKIRTVLLIAYLSVVAFCVSALRPATLTTPRSQALLRRRLKETPCSSATNMLDIGGHDGIGSQTGLTNSACCDACAKLAGCKAAVWVASELSCYFKDAAAPTHPAADGSWVIVPGILKVLESELLEEERDVSTVEAAITDEAPTPTLRGDSNHGLKRNMFVGEHDFKLHGANGYEQEVTPSIAARGFSDDDDAASARLMGFTAKLTRGESVKIVVLGGSASKELTGVSTAHWREQGPYAQGLEQWLNAAYPRPPGAKGHNVVNLAEPGQGSGAFAQKLMLLRPQWGDADLILIEFGINDGDDGKVHPWDLKGTEANFEAVLRALLGHSETIAVLTLELASAAYRPSFGAKASLQCVAASAIQPNANKVTGHSWLFQAGSLGRQFVSTSVDGDAKKKHGCVPEVDHSEQWKEPRTASWVHRPIARFYGVPSIDFTKAFRVDEMMRTIDEAWRREGALSIEELPFGCRTLPPWDHHHSTWPTWSTADSWRDDAELKCSQCTQLGCFASPPSTKEWCRSTSGSSNQRCQFAPERALYCQCISVWWPELHLQDREHHHGGPMMHEAITSLVILRLAQAQARRERLGVPLHMLQAFPIPAGFLHSDAEYGVLVEKLLPDRTVLYATADALGVRNARGDTVLESNEDVSSAWSRSDNLACLHFSDCPSFAPRGERQCSAAYWSKVDALLPQYDGSYASASASYDAAIGGWQYRAYNKKKRGWIYNNPGEGQAFALRLSFDTGDAKSTYKIRLGILRSYEKMGAFSVVVMLCDGSETSIEVDGEWSKHESVFSTVDLPLTLVGGTHVGEVLVVITPHAMRQGRSGNKVKVLSISVVKDIHTA